MTFKFSDEFIQDVQNEYGKDFAQYLNKALIRGDAVGYNFIRTFLDAPRTPPAWEVLLDTPAIDIKVEGARKLRRQALHTRCLQEWSIYNTERIREDSVVKD